MAEWVTQREAAELLGVHPITVAKMVRRGDLTSRDERPSLSRDQVFELASARRDAALARARWRTSTGPPDDRHEWLLAPAAAAVLGCTETALYGRTTRGQVPYVVHGRRRWYRLDLLELVVRAQVARATRRTRPGAPRGECAAGRVHI
jgi:hypothetical protein